ncbi:hydroxymethylglutaryl-CoA synthase [Methylobacterium nodulans]|uniref:Hydroxymethylglutaryl-CoA synthase n=1 Tax=Methylobacterium nodulans (strain LMG 21967 / CNCM I-2342 / ORS 2060) TaxID=460265 RepID=B8IXH7_METNO|nr:hydroxymethylglutaryl-CoA synthase [Methylobacterium nodulans]ACL63218.1 hydroxymethylglutaryl-CoA synthase [Methylobacterium nodulans ORS 2060]
MTGVGIDDISIYTPEYYYSLHDLVIAHGIDPNKYLVGIGQERMAVPPPDEDVVSMAANAVAPLLTRQLRDTVSTVIFATESGIDQSKSAGLFVHGLLGLNPHCRVVEFKQACYSATAGIQLAADLVRQRPMEKVLVIASDIARYERGSEGECTQGAGAVAMVISANPRLLELHPVSGLYSVDVMDFWRPNHRSTACVDGKLSIDVYLRSLAEAWADYRRKGGLPLGAVDKLCFHQPFTRMAKKAFAALSEAAGSEAAHLDESCYADSQIYGRAIGNTYSASLYIGLCSLLDRCGEDLGGRTIGLFSYGSGAVGEFFTATVKPQYRRHLRAEAHRAMLDSRRRLDGRTYAAWFYDAPSQAEDRVFPQESRGRFRLAAIEGQRRIYAAASSEPARAAA